METKNKMEKECPETCIHGCQGTCLPPMEQLDTSESVEHSKLNCVAIKK